MNITKGIAVKGQKVVVYGPEGIGKTLFASKFPDPVYIDTEGSTRQYDLQRSDPASWAAIIQDVQDVISGSVTCRTLVLDTADWAERMATKAVITSHQWGGIEDASYGKGYQYVYEEFSKLLNLLSEVSEHGINVVITAHATMRKFEQPDELGTYDRWEMKLQNSQRANDCAVLKEWADTIVFANYKTFTINANDAKKAKDVKKKATGARRCMYLNHHPCWDAKNRWGITDDIDDPYDFDYEIIRPYIERKAASQTTETVPEKTKTPDHDEARELNELREAHMNPPEPAPEAAKAAVPSEEKKESLRDQQNDPDDRKARQAETEALKIPKALKDLMISNNVGAWDIQNIVGLKGYFPSDMDIQDYPDNFIEGCLVAAWPQVFELIKTVNEKQQIPY